MLGEGRLRLDLTTWSESVEASARIKTDVVHDAVDGQVDLDVREAYVDYTAGAFDFRLGRQIATWGVGDLVFINDIFPKDWVSFFTGRPLEYLKIGVDGVRARFSSGALNLELVAIPFFTPDNIPTAGRFYLSDPFAGVAVRNRQDPGRTYGDTEAALRLYRRVGNFDVSAYVYRGFWRTPGFKPDPAMAPERVTTLFPSLSVYGASAQGGVLGGVLSLEYGYYDSRGDSRDVIGIPSSQTRLLAGYQRELAPDFNLGVQYYVEINPDAQTPEVDIDGPSRYRDTATVRLERRVRHQTWNVALFAFLSPADRDYLLQPQTSYKVSDEFSVTLGANVFGGRETTFLGRFDANDNLYVSLRFDF